MPMKKTIGSLFCATILLAASIQVHAQGLVYDQQSATGPVAVVGNGNADGLDIQEDSPLMQSFTPTFSAIGFVQFEFWDIPNNGTNGATVYVNLWTGSPNPRLATLLGSTTAVYMPNGFVNGGLSIAGITNFSFSTPISLTPGQTYYLEPIVASGDDPWDIITIGNTYPNGQLYGKTGGFFQPSTDFYFREGIVSVPEPSIFALIGLSGLLVFGFKRRSKLVVPFLVGILCRSSFARLCRAVNEIFASFNWHQAFPRTTESQLNPKRSGNKDVYFPCLDFLKIARRDLSFFSQSLLCQALPNPFTAHIRAENLDPLPLFFGNSHSILHRFLSQNMNDTLYREIFSDFYCISPNV